MALTKVTGQVIKNTTDVTVGVLTVTNTLAVGGTVSIGGTLTYEDVTNVDAVGLVTARNGIVVGSGITLSKDGDVFATGVTTTGSLVSSGAISGTTGTFSGAVSGTTGTFTGVVTLVDGGANGLKIGNGQDLILQHNGTQTFIDNNTGNLTLQTTGSGEDINIESLDDVFIKVHGSENAIRCIGDGAVELYYDATKKLETGTNGIVVTGQIYGNSGMIVGAAGGDSSLELYSDAGGQDADKIRIRQTHVGNSFLIESYSSGAYQSILKGTDARTIELHHQGTKKLETAAEGVVIPSGTGNCLRVFGQNTSHATSALVIGQNSTTVSQLRAYGPDTSTNGEINLRTSRSDGSNSVNLTYNGNLVMADGYGIDFSADSNASGMASEVLDDYERGSHAATANALSTGSISVSKYEYVKVGSLVHINFYITFSSTADSDAVQLSLPFTNSQDHTWTAFSAHTNRPSGINPFIGRFRANENLMEFRTLVGDSALTYNDVNGYWLIGGGTYRTLT